LLNIYFDFFPQEYGAPDLLSFLIKGRCHKFKRILLNVSLSIFSSLHLCSPFYKVFTGSDCSNLFTVFIGCYLYCFLGMFIKVILRKLGVLIFLAVANFSSKNLSMKFGRKVSGQTLIDRQFQSFKTRDFKPWVEVLLFICIIICLKKNQILQSGFQISLQMLTCKTMVSILFK
jgi:hypothetical protein